MWFAPENHNYMCHVCAKEFQTETEQLLTKY